MTTMFHAFKALHAATTLNMITFQPIAMPRQELRAEYGHDAVGWYSANTFNENVPPSADPAYLRTTSAAIYRVSEGGWLAACILMRC